MNLTKEYLVFILPSSAFDHVGDIDSDILDSWSESDPLPTKALEYIDACESYGHVCSLKGFQTCFNLSEVDTNTDFIFITNNYPV